MNTRDVLAGAGMGVALAFLLDPSSGARRRARARDKVRRFSRKTWEGADAAARDLANRTRGVAAATRDRLKRERVTDDVLVERVRAMLGRACSHPRAIGVEARDGRVILRGPILASEVQGLLAAVAAVRGVDSVESALDRHERADGIPALQGGSRRPGTRWGSGTRALMGVGLLAAGMVAAAATRGDGRAPVKA